MAPWLVLRVEGRAGGGGLNLFQQKVLARPWTLDQCHSREKKRFYPSYRCAFKDTVWICHHGPSLQKELRDPMPPRLAGQPLPYGELHHSLFITQPPISDCPFAPPTWVLDLSVTVPISPCPFISWIP